MGRSALIILLFGIKSFCAWSQLSVNWGAAQRLKGQEAILSVLKIGDDLVWVKITQPPLGYHKVSVQRFSLPSLQALETNEIHNGKPFRTPGSLMRPEFRGLGKLGEALFLFTHVHDPVQSQTFSAVRKVFSESGEPLQKLPVMLKRYRDVEMASSVLFYFLNPPYFNEFGLLSRVRSSRTEIGVYTFFRFSEDGALLSEHPIPVLSSFPEDQIERIEWVEQDLLRVIQLANLSPREARRKGLDRGVSSLFISYEFRFSGDTVYTRVDSLIAGNHTLLEVGSLGEYGLWAATQRGKEAERQEVGWLWFRRNASDSLKAKYFSFGLREEFEQPRLNLPTFSFPLEQDIIPVLTHWFPVSGGLLWVGEMRNQGEFCQTDFRSNRLICTPYVLCEDILIALIGWDGEPVWRLRVPRQQFLQGERSVGLASHWAVFRNDKLYLLWNDDLRNVSEQGSRWAFIDPGRSRLASLEVSLGGEMKRGWVNSTIKRTPSIAPAFSYADSVRVFVTGVRGSRIIPGIVSFSDSAE